MENPQGLNPNPCSSLMRAKKNIQDEETFAMGAQVQINLQ